eukprot:g1935.t1
MNRVSTSTRRLSSSRASRRSGAGTPVSSEFSYSDGEQVNVVLRVRPMMHHETQRGDRRSVFVDPNGAEVVVELEDTGERQSFNFKQCFDSHTTQEQLFEESGVKEILDRALNGYAATVFAYGQTGSGKTYTMSGQEEKISMETYSQAGDPHEGLIPRSINYLFNEVKTLSQDRAVTYTIRASYCEIYNEQVFDLLNMNQEPLSVRWNIRSGFFVQDLFVVECETIGDLRAVVTEGHRNRRIGSHELNKDSSRSHSLLSIHLESETVDPDDGHALMKFGKVVFVDLAGSERLKDSKSHGDRATETGSINKSLFTLGKVISALSDNERKKKQSFVPYRDSKLTKLLMDSLGGTSMTVMLACCSPSSTYLDETLSTLNYASRAKKIQNRPSIQVDPKEQLIFDLRQEAKLLRMENTFLRSQIEAINNGRPPQSPLPPPLSPMKTSSSSASSGSSIRPMRTLSRSNESGEAMGGGGGGGPGGGRRTSTNRTRSRGDGQQSVAHTLERAASNSTINAIGAPPGFTTGPPPSSSGTNVPPLLPRNNGRGTHSSSSSPSHYKSLDSSRQLRPASSNTAQAQRMITQYHGEIERLKKENREMRARGSIAERNYRTVMTENERLSKKIEHLEEIFVHHPGKDRFSKEINFFEGKTQEEKSSNEEGKVNSLSSNSSVGSTSENMNAIIAENRALRAQIVQLQRMQSIFQQQFQQRRNVPNQMNGHMSGGHMRLNNSSSSQIHSGGSGQHSKTKEYAVNEQEIQNMRRELEQQKKKIGILRQREVEYFKLVDGNLGLNFFYEKLKRKK